MNEFLYRHYLGDFVNAFLAEKTENDVNYFLFQAKFMRKKEKQEELFQSVCEALYDAHTKKLLTYDCSIEKTIDKDLCVVKETQKALVSSDGSNYLIVAEGIYIVENLDCYQEFAYKIDSDSDDAIYSVKLYRLLEDGAPSLITDFSELDGYSKEYFTESREWFDKMIQQDESLATEDNFWGDDGWEEEARIFDSQRWR